MGMMGYNKKFKYSININVAEACTYNMWQAKEATI